MLRNPNDIAFAVMFLLVATIGADLYALYADYELLVAARDHAGDASWLEFAVANMTAAGGIQLLALLSTGVTFLVWFRRCRANAEVWAGDLQRRSPGWALGGWFIPVGNLWIPRGIAVDIWRASRRDPSSADRPFEFLLLNVWWTFFLVDTTMSQLVANDIRVADTSAQWASVAKSLLISDGLDVVAAVLAILFVRRLTAMQNAKATGVMVPAAQ
ncbi:DUF4328 domain-containing protein [Streptomyces sp. NPDC020807]|uniref:DUF4328 domain-containing protein n=1 Tax=Streptomyces sp. NPDC020807 TaxID=3155119 RepID=UPI0033F4DB02